MRAALAGLLSLLPLSAAAVDAVAEYARRAALPANERCAGNSIELPVTLSQEALVDTAYDTATGRLRILYRMQFNDLTEGWNWHPDIAAAGGDYYTFKYLPSVQVRKR